MSLAGRGRTTTGMVIATIFSYWRHKLTPTVNVPKPIVDFKTILRLTRALKNGQRAKKLTDSAIYQCRSISSLSHFLTLFDILSFQLSIIITTTTTENNNNHCEVMNLLPLNYSAMQNLRESIKSLKDQIANILDVEKKQLYTQRAQYYLLRYFYLILFASYLDEQVNLLDFIFVFVGSFMSDSIQLMRAFVCSRIRIEESLKTLRSG
jgi:hypothetical protein